MNETTKEKGYRNRDLSTRVQQVFNWFKFNGIAKNNKDIAKKLEMDENYISTIVNGKTPVSDKFLRKLCGLSENLNFDWIKTGEGNMLYKPDDFIYTSPEAADKKNLAKALEVIENLTAQLNEKDKQISRLIDLLDTKKTAHVEDAACAVVK